jgi:SAM-dependent methyltransferase
VLDQPAGALCVSIGGGPKRTGRFLNLNIEPFENVDVVADAHALPYDDGSVDAIHSEAVFEHLHTPHIAAAEIARVLKPGAVAYVCTPFIAPFHGYPSHFQNFTEAGHRRLFENAGLEIVESGVCVGPTMSLLQVWRAFGEVLPVGLREIAKAIFFAGRVLLTPLDRFLGERENAHIVASTTYLVARKPH